MVVQNHGTSAVRLKEGLWLGTVTPVDLVTDAEEGGIADRSGDAQEDNVESDTSVRQLDTEPSSANHRVDKLFAQLKRETNHLTPEEQQSLQSLLALYSDVFALNSNELGTTDVVTHSIDTGEHEPVRQQVR